MQKYLTIAVLVALIGVPYAYAGNETPDAAKTTSKAYVDTEIDTTQAIMPAKSSDKIVTYGATAGAMGERAIITDPDDVTTGNTGVMTVNAMEGVYEKQDNILNIPNNNVVTSCGDGCLSSRHIYADANGKRMGDGLVEAQTVNTAVTGAINGRFTQVDTGGNESLSGTLWRINSISNPITVNTTLDASINGTGYCYRGLNGTNNSDGGSGANACSASTLTYLNTSPSRGKWGTKFAWGEVSGYSVCSNVTPPDTMIYDHGSDGVPYYNWGYVADGTRSTTLDGQYNTQKENGTLNADQYYCWCKMTNPGVSSWVFNYSYGDSADCAYLCALSCASNVRINADFRGAVFGSVQQ